jgi:carboxyl-terminal processing protease
MYDPQNQRRRRLFPILLVFGGFGFFTVPLVLGAFVLGIQVERHGGLSHGGEPAEARQLFQPFWETWYLVHENYADPSSVKDERLMQWSIRGMLASLGDTGHTTYLTRDEVQQLTESLQGKLEGIGARITLRKQGVPTIVQTMPKSPAREAGLRPGDVILQVDGQDVYGLSLPQLVQHIKGPAGSTVHLKVLRGDPAKTVELDIRRAEVDVPDVAWQMMPEVPLAHIAILNFGKNADEQLRDALAQARKEGAKGLILDVRGNPGGLKDQAVKVTSEFLKPDEVVFIEKDARGNTKPVPVQPGGVAQDIPMCLLINDGTASSAEILAGALQDYQRGKLIGERTVGTGTVLREFKLSDGSAVLLAVDQWLTPKERQIWHKGITPDIVVEMPLGASILLPESGTKLSAKALADNKDAQLLKAIEVLKKELP